MLFEKLVCGIMNKLFPVFCPGMPKEKRVKITMRILGTLGFIIETIIIIMIALLVGSLYRVILFFFIFGLLRLRNAEHYKTWLRCMTATSLIFCVYLIASMNFIDTLLTDILWCIAISLLFRDWHRND